MMISAGSVARQLAEQLKVSHGMLIVVLRAGSSCADGLWISQSIAPGYHWIVIKSNRSSAVRACKAEGGSFFRSGNMEASARGLRSHET